MASDGVNDGYYDEDDDEDLVCIPDPREASTVQVGFTERFFMTPARVEGPGEEDWLRNRSHVGKRWGMKKDNSAAGDARDISERDPFW